MPGRGDAAIKFIREIRTLLIREADAIGKKQFSEIGRLLPYKVQMHEKCVELLSKVGRTRDTDAIIAELEVVRRKAEENAAALEHLRNGVLAAQRRLSALAEAEQQTSWYTNKIVGKERATSRRGAALAEF